MSGTQLERARQAHEFVEAYEKAAVDVLETKPKTNKQRVWQQHKIQRILNKISEQSAMLSDLYREDNDILREEAESMRGKDVFTSFYKALRDTREHHHRYPHIDVQHDPPLDKDLDIQVPFSGEEVFGKYFDLHEQHDALCNILQTYIDRKNATQSSGKNKNKSTKRKFAPGLAMEEEGRVNLEYAEYLITLLDFPSLLPAAEKIRGCSLAHSNNKRYDMTRSDAISLNGSNGANSGGLGGMGNLSLLGGGRDNGDDDSANLRKVAHIVQSRNSSEPESTNTDNIASTVPPPTLKPNAYATYLQSLATYLLHFHTRTNPLVPPAHILPRSFERELLDSYLGGKIPGWEVRARPPAPGTGAGAGVAATASSTSTSGPEGATNGGVKYRPLDLSQYHSAKQLEALGPDRLKEALLAAEVKCGGTLRQRAERLFSIKGLAPSAIKPKLRPAGYRTPPPPPPSASTGASIAATDGDASTSVANGHAEEGSGGASNSIGGARGDEGLSYLSAGERVGLELARLEVMITYLCTQPLRSVRQATIKQVDRKRTRTKEELEMELQEEDRLAPPTTTANTTANTSTTSATATTNKPRPAAGDNGGGGDDEEEDEDDGDDDDDDDEEDDEDEGPLYNPLNLPLGWDGKPMPYWLYKLHGLSVEYGCEICGNFVYKGRRNFDRHFQEWRHAYGMRCLGIPNTKHFHDITKIEDALNLYAKIKGQLQTEQFQADAEEEFEDSEGNVLNRRMYEDLARQGLL